MPTCIGNVWRHVWCTLMFVGHKILVGGISTKLFLVVVLNVSSNGQTFISRQRVLELVEKSHKPCSSYVIMFVWVCFFVWLPRKPYLSKMSKTKPLFEGSDHGMHFLLFIWLVERGITYNDLF